MSAEGERRATSITELKTRCAMAGEVHQQVDAVVVRMNNLESSVCSTTLNTFRENNHTLRSTMLEILPQMIACVHVHRANAERACRATEAGIAEQNQIIDHCCGNDSFHPLYMDASAETVARNKLAAFTKQLDSQKAALAAIIKDLEALETELARLRAEEDAMNAASGELRSLLDRVQSQQVPSTAELAELERKLHKVTEGPVRNDADRAGLVAGLEELRLLLEGQTDQLSVLQTMIFQLKAPNSGAIAAAAAAASDTAASAAAALSQEL